MLPGSLSVQSDRAIRNARTGQASAIFRLEIRSPVRIVNLTLNDSGQAGATVARKTGIRNVTVIGFCKLDEAVESGIPAHYLTRSLKGDFWPDSVGVWCLGR